MITAYLLGIPNYYEGEDIEIRFCIFKDEQLLVKESLFKEYKKPLIVGQVALMELLKRLQKFKRDEITVVINDAALYEQIRGTSTSKNKDVIKMALLARKKLEKFGDSITIKDVSNDKVELSKWKDILEF